MLFVLDYWYVWVIGLLLLPVIAVLPQVNNIRQAVKAVRCDQPTCDKKEIANLFLKPGPLAVTILAGIGTFVCVVFFFLAIIFAIIRYIKA